MKEINLNDNNNSSKKNPLHHLNAKTELTNNFYKKNQFYVKTFLKSQDKSIKINLVSQKFKIANDFNEKNSNQFLNEKDECLREVILSDKIEEEKPIHFYAENENKNINNLSAIKKNGFSSYVNSNQIKKTIVEYDSERSLTRLIEEIK